jgi:hypothetical protein
MGFKGVGKIRGENEEYGALPFSIYSRDDLSAAKER